MILQLSKAYKMSYSTKTHVPYCLLSWNFKTHIFFLMKSTQFVSELNHSISSFFKHYPFIIKEIGWYKFYFIWNKPISQFHQMFLFNNFLWCLKTFKQSRLEYCKCNCSLNPSMSKTCETDLHFHCFSPSNGSFPSLGQLFS